MNIFSVTKRVFRKQTIEIVLRGFVLYFFQILHHRPMSILVRREQEEYFFRLKTALNYGTVKGQAGAEVQDSRFTL